MVPKNDKSVRALNMSAEIGPFSINQTKILFLSENFETVISYIDISLDMFNCKASASYIGNT